LLLNAGGEPLPISAIDTITLALEHTKRQLVQPFRLGQWTRLATVGLLAGELGSGGCNVPHHFNIPHQTGSPRNFVNPDFSGLGIDAASLAALAGVIAVLIAVAVVFGIILMYIGCVMRFILFDSVLTKECHIRHGWNRRQVAGWRYFLWQLGLSLVALAGLAVIFGIPAGVALLLGWFQQPSEHVLPLAAGGVVVFLLLMVFAIAVALIHVLTKDFVVPQMALEGIGPIQGWRRLMPMLRVEWGGYVGYVVLKIVLAIAAGIIIGIGALILGLVVAIPTALLAVVAVVTGKTAGFTWNVSTITIAVVAGCILLAIFLYLMSLIAVPAIVFFPAYSIYFFAARYQPLSLALYPPPPPPGSAPPGPHWAPTAAG
jgi:hypothetical protein